MGGEVLSDLGEGLFGGEVLRDTLDELGHEEEAVAVAAVEVGQVILEEVPCQLDAQPVLTDRLHHHHSLLGISSVIRISNHQKTRIFDKLLQNFAIFWMEIGKSSLLFSRLLSLFTQFVERDKG